MKERWLVPKHKLRLLLCLLAVLGLVSLTENTRQQAQQVRTLAANRPVSLTDHTGTTTPVLVPDTTTTTSAPPAPTSTEPQPVTTEPPPTQPPARPITTVPEEPPEEEAPQPAEPAPSYGGDDVWYRLANCESGGNWSISSGNGYYGGLQMDMGFWSSYKDGEWPSRPDYATAEQQIIAASRARDSGRGYNPWPGCARKLGLI